MLPTSKHAERSIGLDSMIVQRAIGPIQMFIVEWWFIQCHHVWNLLYLVVQFGRDERLFNDIFDTPNRFLRDVPWE
jgi:hypothetical protein